MTPKERAVMQQALEALERWRDWDDWNNTAAWGLDDEDTITALREALAEQAEQEPVAWIEIERGIPMFVKFADKYKPNCDGFIPLYAAPSRTKDLTEEDINELWNTALMIADPTAGNLRFKFARTVIAADREKNK